MKISELPQEIREKALEYQRNQEQNKFNDWDKKTDSLYDAFFWRETKEGYDYWDDWYNRVFIKENTKSKAIDKLTEMLDRKETTSKNGKNDFDIIQLKEIINLLK